MEAFSPLRHDPPKPMADPHMDLHLHTPAQQSLLPQLIPLVPGRRFLPDSEDIRNLKRTYSAEDKKGEDEDDELLFDIDEFLVEEDALIHGGDDGSATNEGATIIAQSPTNTNPNPSTSEKENNIDPPIPDVPNTNAAIINVKTNDNNTANNSKSKNNNNSKKKRKKKSTSKTTKPDACVPPKRPLSAYNLYFREERKRRIADAASSQKKYNFEELGRLIGKGWRSLPIKEKRELEDRAETDRERYRNEMIAYRREKRRRAREEDQDTLIFMRQKHSLTPCPPSPRGQQQLPPGCFTPKRTVEQYPFQRYVTISPGQRDYPQEPRYPQQNKHHLYPNDSANKNHVRKVSVSISSPMYDRSVNNTSPAVSSYESCSSLSGDDGANESMRKRKNNREENKERDVAGERDNSNNTHANKGSTPSNDPRYKPPVTRIPEVPVARVVAMPATDGLQRMLQESVPSQTFSQQPNDWAAPWGRPPPYHAPVQHASPYTPPPAPAATAADPRRYSPPPQSSFGSQQPHYSSSPPLPLSFTHASQMLPMGMSILLRDPNTGKELSYRIQYTPKLMTQEQANQFQRDHEGGVVFDDKGQSQAQKSGCGL